MAIYSYIWLYTAIYGYLNKKNNIHGPTYEVKLKKHYYKYQQQY